jgi:hypothetical protein
MMVDDVGKPPKADNGFAVRLLVDETGITEGQARDLIGILGLNWSSLVREARILKPKPH